MLMQVIPRKNFPHSRKINDGLADAREALAVDLSSRALGTHLNIVELAGWLVRLGVDMVTGACTIATIVSVTALNTVAPVPCATDVGTNEVIDMLPIKVIGVVSGSEIELSGVVANSRLKSPTALVSKEETLGFNWDAYTCCPTTM